MHELEIEPYIEYSSASENDPRTCNLEVAVEEIVRIVGVEGPMIVKRAYDLYLRSCGIKQIGHDLKSTLNKTLAVAIRQGSLALENESNQGGFTFATIRLNGNDPIKLRSRGERSFEEIPPSELQVVAKYLAHKEGLITGSDEHFRAILEWFDLKRLTTQVNTSLQEILQSELPHADKFLSSISVRSD